MIMNPNRKYDDQNGLRNNPNYDVSKPTAEARQIQKLMLLFQMCYIGAPMIYYGDEAGMWGADDPDDRKPMLWADLTYENERTHPVPGKTRTDDPVKFDKELFDYYKTLVRIRKDVAALRRGDFTTLLADDTRGVYAFRRSTGDSEAIVVINNGSVPQSVDLKIDGARKYRNEVIGGLLEGTEFLHCSLERKSGTVLVRQ
jgi:glycosidase